MNRSVEDLLTKCTILKTCEDRLLSSICNYDTIRRLTTTTLSILLALSDIGLAKTRQFLYITDPYCCLVSGFWKHITKVLLKLCQFLVDFLHTSHLLLWKQGTSVGEVLVNHL